MKRREFVGMAAAATAFGVRAVSPAEVRKTVGIQFGAVSVLDEGLESVLDTFQQRGCVNTLVPATFSFSRGTAGRHFPFPDHGRHERDDGFRGGNFARVDPRFYRDTGIDARATRAPDHGDFDLLDALLPAARKRGLEVICLLQDHFPGDFPGAERLQERDFNGQRAERLCKNNPMYRNFLLGLVEDLTRSYPIDGILFVLEHQGAFSDTLGARLRGKLRGLPGSRTCFCDFCRDKATRLGIRFDRVLTAFRELEKFVRDGRARRRPEDGYYVTFWRLLLRHPELLMWEHFFHESVREVYRLLHARVRSVRESARFGLHVWQNASLSPIYRAEQDFAELASCADFLKISAYHSCGGPRIASYVESVGETLYGDVPPERLLQFHYDVLNLQEAPYDRVRETGLSAAYVHRETRRALADARGAVPVYTGIDVDIPVSDADLGGLDGSKAVRHTRGSVREAVTQAFLAGAPGIFISRKYAEMRLDTLSGVGDAIREMGLAT